MMNFLFICVTGNSRSVTVMHFPVSVPQSRVANKEMTLCHRCFPVLRLSELHLSPHFHAKQLSENQSGNVTSVEKFLSAFAARLFAGCQMMCAAISSAHWHSVGGQENHPCLSPAFRGQSTE